MQRACNTSVTRFHVVCGADPLRREARQHSERLIGSPGEVCASPPSLTDGDALPAKKRLLHESHLFRGKFAEAAQKVLGRNGLDSLDEERAF